MEKHDDDDDDDDEERTETTGRLTYDTPERNGRYAPIQTNPEDDATQRHTDEEKYRVRILKLYFGAPTEM